MHFKEKLNQFYNEFGEYKLMVLSTSLNDKVTSRMMSIIMVKNKFYFQTDKAFRKYNQLTKNPNVALCADNIQLEGVCRKIGKPIDNYEFCCLYKKYFKNSYEMYSTLESEVLFEITPVFIERWIYENGKPFIEIYNIHEEKYIKKKYGVYGEVNDN